MSRSLWRVVGRVRRVPGSVPGERNRPRFEARMVYLAWPEWPDKDTLEAALVRGWSQYPCEAEVVSVTPQGDKDPRQAEGQITVQWPEHPDDEGPPLTGLRRGHLADLEVAEAMLESDPRGPEATAFDIEPQRIAEAVRAMIDNPELHNPDSYTHLSPTTEAALDE